MVIILNGNLFVSQLELKNYEIKVVGFIEEVVVYKCTSASYSTKYGTTKRNI